MSKAEEILKQTEAKDKGVSIQDAFKKISIDMDRYVKTKMGKDNIHYQKITELLQEIKGELSKVVRLEL